ncbi:MAG TPA: hypothetical protein PK821_06360 [Victivallales bacterium]|nr:hypothetical protein [Victivallales bacterium]
MKKLVQIYFEIFFKVLLLVFFLVIGESMAQACTTPVFRHALEYWPASPFRLVIPSDANPFSESEQKALKALKVAEDAGLLNISTVKDSDKDLSESERELLKTYKSEERGNRQALLFFPLDSQLPELSIPLKLEPGAVMRILNSPMREEIAKQILSGKTAVWLLVEGEDKAKNDHVAEMITAKLAKLNKDLHLSDMAEDETVESIQTGSAIEIKIDFSLMRIRPDDPQETYLVETLKNLLYEFKPGQQILAAIYARGRAIQVLSEDEITEDSIKQIASFLVGPCSCLVKAENPGIDLLFAVEWEDLIFEGGRKLDPLKVTLVGLDEFMAYSDREKNIIDGDARSGNIPSVEEGDPSLWKITLASLAAVAIIFIIIYLFLRCKFRSKEEKQ